MIALVLLAIFGIMGTSYWLTSRVSTDMIVREAHRIKARALAQAAVEKVKINIINHYSSGDHNLEYPSKFVKDRTDKEYNIEFPDGSFSVLSVKPYDSPTSNRSFYNVPHKQKGVIIGRYDIWEVVTSGKVKATGITAEITSLIKVYRDYVSY